MSPELDSERWKEVMSPIVDSGKICVLISQLNLVSILPFLYSIAVCCIFKVIL